MEFERFGMLQYIEDEVKRIGSQQKAADIWGISPPYLGDILHGRREPGKKLLDAIGFERVTTYRQTMREEAEAGKDKEPE